MYVVIYMYLLTMRMYCMYIYVQNVVIGADTGHKLQTEVMHPLYIALIVKYCLLTVGIVLLLCACVLMIRLFYQRCRHSVTCPLLLDAQYWLSSGLDLRGQGTTGAQVSYSRLPPTKR